MSENLLYGYHDDVDNSYIINRPGDPFGLIVMGSGFPDTEAHFDSPHQE